MEKKADGVEDDVGEAHAEAAGADAAFQPRYFNERQSARRLLVEHPLDVIGVHERVILDGRPLPLLAVEAGEATAAAIGEVVRRIRRHGALGRSAMVWVQLQPAGIGYKRRQPTKRSNCLNHPGINPDPTQ